MTDWLFSTLNFLIRLKKAKNMTTISVKDSLRAATEVSPVAVRPLFTQIRVSRAS